MLKEYCEQSIVKGSKLEGKCGREREKLKRRKGEGWIGESEKDDRWGLEGREGHQPIQADWVSFSCFSVGVIHKYP